MTRRSRDQLSSVVHANSLKRRAGLPLASAALLAAASSLSIIATRRALRQAEQIIDPVHLAPDHQRLAGEPGIGPQQDAHVWPAGADPRHDPGDLLHRSGARVDVGSAKLRRQQMAAAEHIKRQIAVAVVIAVEEAALLMAVQRVVGGVEIEDDLLGRGCDASRNRSMSSASIIA